MAIQTNFPAIKPTLLLDFANTEQLDPRITFTRASTATYYGTQTAKAEENLLLQSQTFDNASWTKTRSTVTANDTTAPDGTTTADKIQQNAGVTTAGLCQQSATSVSGSSYVISVFAKAGTNKNFLLVQDTLFSAAGSEVWFDVLNGTVGTVERPASHTASIVSVGNGWFRCIVQFAASVSNAGVVSFYAAQTDNTTTVTDDQGFIYVWGAQLEQRSAVTAYTPTTTQTITNYIPRLLTAASGVARFDHNPTTFESLGLEIEEQRTNLLTYSSQFDDAAWIKFQSTTTANTIVAPDGTLTGDKLVENTAIGSHVVIGGNASVTSGVAYTTSIYAKAAERSHVRLTYPQSLFGGATSDSGATFDLIAGTVQTQAGNPSPGVTASIQSVGNGWYRCQITMTATSSGTLTLVRCYVAVASGTNYTGDGYSGIYIWGAQLEAGAFATSYIPTVASQVTRAADAASMTGTNFSSWYNAAEGTLFAEANTPSFATTYVFAEINNNSTSNYVRQSTTSAGTTTQFVVVDNTVTQASPGFAVTLGSYRKMAGAYTANSVQQSVNGSLGTEDTSATIPTGLVQINIGSRASGASAVNGTIRKIAYYPIRVSNTNLQALTS